MCYIRLKNYQIRFLLFILSIIYSFDDYGQNDYSINAIPDSLIENANSVIRKYETTYIYESPRKITQTVHIVISILNESGDNNAILNIPYDDSRHVKSITGKIYNSFGNTIKIVEKKKIEDWAASGYSLFSDNRIKHYSPKHKKYPYTVDYKYVIKHDGLIGYSLWYPIDTYNKSLESAELKFISKVPGVMKFRDKNFPGDFSKTLYNNELVHLWKINNICSFEYESYSPHFFDILPVIYLSPNDFYYEGNYGDLDSWNSYGQWMYSLIKDKNELTDNVQTIVKEITSGLITDKEKAKAIYQYLQNNNRYVSIQVGIGGFQPASAKEVCNLGYGDCKALSNYTLSLLKEAGIKSYYSEIGSGDYQTILFEDFASANQTNHVIICLPFDGDTTWLECTSLRYPFGYIGRGNSNRKALLITEQGGKLANTTSYLNDINSRSIKMNIAIDKNGNIEGRINYRSSGIFYDDLAMISHEDDKTIREIILKKIDINSLIINEYKTGEKKDLIPQSSLEVHLSANKYVTMTGDIIYFDINPTNKTSPISTRKQDRKNDLYFEFGFTDTDTIEFTIPDGYHCVNKPEETNLECLMGKYKSVFSIDGNNLRYIRNMSLIQGQYNTNSYPEFYDFIEAVAKNDREKILLRKNTN